MKRIFPAVLWLMLLPPLASADTIVLKHGRSIETDQTWEQKGNIFFYLHGLKMQVSKKEVLRIVQTKETVNAEPDGVKENTFQTRIPSDRPGPAGKTIKVDPLPAEVPSDAQSGKNQPEIRWSGFRDLRWAAGRSAFGRLKELEQQSGQEEMKEWVRVDEDLKVGKARLDSIVYTFWRYNLYAVAVWTTGRNNYRALRNEIFNRFGVGLMNDQTRERYIWSDPYSDRMLKYAEADQSGLFWMRSKELYRRYQLSQINPPPADLNAMEAKALRTN
jgi:hypothetical protein